MGILNEKRCKKVEQIKRESNKKENQIKENQIKKITKDINK